MKEQKKVVTRRKLEELNLIDDFLFQETITYEGGDEVCRILLSTVLGQNIRKVKVIAQKGILGMDTDKHGIRLDAYVEEIPNWNIDGKESADVELIPDIYDIEPNNTNEKNNLPKRTRYYHGLMDAKLLSTGVSYDMLPNVYIIMILPYDPFGKNRMVYTIENTCKEDPTIDYHDGAVKIYLYTRGSQGNYSQELCDMLKYMESTTEENITNQSIETIHRIVSRVKMSKEVGINYMKSWEREQMIKERAEKEGREAGMAKGMAKGMEKGMAKGKVEGEYVKLISLIRKKCAKDVNEKACAEMLEEDIDSVSNIYHLISEHPDMSDEEIYEVYIQKTEEK